MGIDGFHFYGDRIDYFIWKIDNAGTYLVIKKIVLLNFIVLLSTPFTNPFR